MIMGEWKEYKLGEVAEIVTGYPFPSEKYEATGTLRVVRGENVTIGKLRWDVEKHWNLDIAGLEKYLLRPDDIVIGMDGSRVGSNRALIRETDLPLFLAQRVACLRAINGFDSKYIWYTIFSDTFRKYVEAINTGTSIPHISQKQIAEFEIMCPSEAEQKRIAGVLSSLDDKIDLLHLENATLEALAETLFRHYFIENPNPDWKEGKLTDFIKIIGGGTPKTNEPSYWNGDIGWLSGGDISGNHKNYILNVEKYITQKGVDNSSVNILPENSMIISARGTVGKYCLLGRPMSFSQSNYGILPKINGCYFFTYLLVSRYVEEMKNAAYGSVFDTITTKTFESIDVFLPSEKEVIVVFDNQVKPIFEKLKRNQLQIQSMLSQRDTLLPRLMSGEVKVGE